MRKHKLERRQLRTPSLPILLHPWSNPHLSGHSLNERPGSSSFSVPETPPESRPRRRASGVVENRSSSSVRIDAASVTSTTGITESKGAPSALPSLPIGDHGLPHRGERLSIRRRGLGKPIEDALSPAFLAKQASKAAPHSVGAPQPNAPVASAAAVLPVGGSAVQSAWLNSPQLPSSSVPAQGLGSSNSLLDVVAQLKGLSPSKMSQRWGDHDPDSEPIHPQVDQVMADDDATQQVRLPPSPSTPRPAAARQSPPSALSLRPSPLLSSVSPSAPSFANSHVPASLHYRLT